MGRHVELAEDGVNEGSVESYQFATSPSQGYGDSVSYDMISTVVLVKAESPSTHAMTRARSR
ncbi:hypothetical protein [Haladaptatus sp. R4]|uniref:hypothetical protein n=1 Tax=Haladaptatus sp. R4 TaxID=1679489 RepID=UPI0012371441|nr:hypothetical protein [Haladaptatus sp. R4]